MPNKDSVLRKYEGNCYLSITRICLQLSVSFKPQLLFLKCLQSYKFPSKPCNYLYTTPSANRPLWVYYYITISSLVSNYGFLYSPETLVYTVDKDLVNESAKVLIFWMKLLNTLALCYLFPGSLQMRNKVSAFGIKLEYENYLSPSFLTGHSSIYCAFFCLGKPVMIITEYMENGSLDAFLRVGNCDQII